MITVGLTRKGTVTLTPRDDEDRAAIRGLDYLRWRKGRAATHYTYLQDLRRDVPPQKLRWSSGIKATLRALTQELKDRIIGSDDEVLAVFGRMTPYPFQLEGIHFLLGSERTLLGDNVGLGKTIQTWAALLVLFARGDVRRAVIVVPSGLKLQWYEELYELAREDAIPEPVVVVSGEKGARSKLYRKDWRVLIINPALVRVDYDALRRVRDVDFVAVDEASCLRNPETVTYQSIADLWGSCRFKLALTATPVETSLHDLRAIFSWVNPRIFPSKRYFNMRYVVWRKTKVRVRKKGGGTFKLEKLEVVKYRRLNEVRSKIRPSYLRRRVSDVGLQLPSLVVSWERVILSPRQRKVYVAIRESVADGIENLRGEALRGKLQGLRQVCNSTHLVAPSKTKPGQVKVDRLKELLDSELRGEKVIVFTEYEKFARLLARELKGRGAVAYTGTKNMTVRQRRSALASFTHGEKKILVATSTAERGHNLQIASVVVNMDLPFNPARLKQRLGRVLRIGSKHGTVRMVNMIAAGTIEERLILKKIYKRRKLFEDLFDQDELSQADPLERMGGVQLRKLL